MSDKIFYVNVDALNVRSEPSVDGDKWELLEKGTRILAAGEPVNGWLPIQMDDGATAYVAEKYVTEEVVEPELSVSPPVYNSEVINHTSDQPIWLQWMLSKLGLQEVPGAGDNPEIIDWMKLTTLPRSMWHDATAWCSVTVNAAFMLNEMKGTRSAAAVDWLGWGKKSKPVLGAVAVFEWKDKNGRVTGHHVGVVLDQTDTRVQVIGGNQSNAVTKQWYSKASVMGYRWPVEDFPYA
jgi:uncharacterized protein (TIGR02594 family)